MNRGYELFKKRVAEGRKMTLAQVENIAQGRVWLGEDAKKIGLVDEIGGLNRAIAKAATQEHSRRSLRTSNDDERIRTNGQGSSSYALYHQHQIACKI